MGSRGAVVRQQPRLLDQGEIELSCERGVRSLFLEINYTFFTNLYRNGIVDYLTGSFFAPGGLGQKR